MKSVSQEQALSSILGLTKPLGLEYVLLEHCNGRTLAKNLVSKIFSTMRIANIFFQNWLPQKYPKYSKTIKLIKF